MKFTIYLLFILIIFAVCSSCGSANSTANVCPAYKKVYANGNMKSNVKNWKKVQNKKNRKEYTRAKSS
jgi:uncharacterized protein YceK